MSLLRANPVRPAFSPSDGARENSILIVGVGNVLCTDDGVGVHAVRELQKEPIAGVTIADIGTAILHGLDLLESVERVLVIDAVHGGQSPGTIYLYEANLNLTPQAGPRSKEWGEGGDCPAATSIHTMGLLHAMRWLPPEKTPCAITVLGVEPASLEYAMNLSETVKRVLPRIVSMARETVAGWRRTSELSDRSREENQCQKMVEFL